MFFRAILMTVLAGFWWLIGWVAPVFALAQIDLVDLHYRSCPPELAEGAVTSGGTTAAAKCFLVVGKAINKSNRSVVNADVFGRIYDANGNSILENRTRLGAIAEVPPGESEFELRISVPANQPTPLRLEQFKAAGFTGKVRR
jgi:hypothetical protein